MLKGGVLLAGYGLRRPTRDVDIQAIDFVLDDEHCRHVVAMVALGAIQINLIQRAKSVVGEPGRRGDVLRIGRGRRGSRTKPVVAV